MTQIDSARVKPLASSSNGLEIPSFDRIPNFVYSRVDPQFKIICEPPTSAESHKPV